MESFKSAYKSEDIDSVQQPAPEARFIFAIIEQVIVDLRRLKRCHDKHLIQDIELFFTAESKNVLSPCDYYLLMVGATHLSERLHGVVKKEIEHIKRTTVVKDDGMKTCNYCHESQPESSFYSRKQANGRMQLVGKCKNCYNRRRNKGCNGTYG